MLSTTDIEAFSNLNESVILYGGCCSSNLQHLCMRQTGHGPQGVWAFVVALEIAAKGTIPLGYLFSTSVGIIYIHV